MAWLACLVGASPAPALVGSSAEGGELARHAVMVLQRSKGTAGFCSGAVIAADVVLTAAHCVSGPDDTRAYYRESGGKPVFLTVRQVAVHPAFRPDAARTRQRSIDLALIKLDRTLPAEFSPGELARGPGAPLGALLRIAGFGVSREGDGRTGGIFRSSILAVRAPISSILVWLEDPESHGTGACAGDSGGPIFSEVGATIAAITSWSEGPAGKHCGTLTQGVLLAPQRDWIDATLRAWGR